MWATIDAFLVPSFVLGMLLITDMADSHQTRHICLAIGARLSEVIRTIIGLEVCGLHWLL